MFWFIAEETQIKTIWNKFFELIPNWFRFSSEGTRDLLSLKKFLELIRIHSNWSISRSMDLAELKLWLRFIFFRINFSGEALIEKVWINDSDWCRVNSDWLSKKRKEWVGLNKFLGLILYSFGLNLLWGHETRRTEKLSRISIMVVQIELDQTYRFGRIETVLQIVILMELTSEKTHEFNHLQKQVRICTEFTSEEAQWFNRFQKVSRIESGINALIQTE